MQCTSEETNGGFAGRSKKNWFQASFQACLGSHRALATLVTPVAVEHVALDLEKLTKATEHQVENHHVGRLKIM